MRSDRLCYAYIKDAKTISEEARESLSKGHYHRTVRKCQKAVELAIKGLLRFVGIEYQTVVPAARLHNGGLYE